MGPGGRVSECHGWLLCVLRRQTWQCGDGKENENWCIQKFKDLERNGSVVRAIVTLPSDLGLVPSTQFVAPVLRNLMPPSGLSGLQFIGRQNTHMHKIKKKNRKMKPMSAARGRAPCLVACQEEAPGLR